MFRWITAGCLSLMCFGSVEGEDWRQWRGPTSDNHAPASAAVPLRWNLETGSHVVWEQAIPGRGHSSPTVVGDAIYLTTADAQADQQSLLILDRQTGALRHSRVIHDQGLPPRIHPKNSHASPTVASDGELQFAAFYNDGAIRVTATDRQGETVWQQRVCRFAPNAFRFGYGASPIVEGDLVLIAAEYDGPESGLYALDKRTGQPAWQYGRPANLSFSSPIVATLAGRRQLLLPGAERVESFDPRNGRLLWSALASTEATCGTVCWDQDRVYISGGNPVSGTWAVRADGSEALLWDNRVKCYEQSLLTVDGYVYAISDNGVAYCWDAADGSEQWKERLGGNYSASPLLVGDRIYVASEAGEVFVFRATPDRFESLAENRLGDQVFATPVAIGARLFVRYARYEAGRRQEYVAALGR